MVPYPILFINSFINFRCPEGIGESAACRMSLRAFAGKDDEPPAKEFYRYRSWGEYRVKVKKLKEAL